MKLLVKLDPVCAMEVDPSHAGDETVYGGQTYYFCSRACKEVFEQAPESWLRDHPDAALSRRSNPTTSRAFLGSHAGRNRGLSQLREGTPSGRRTRPG